MRRPALAPLWPLLLLLALGLGWQAWRAPVPPAAPAPVAGADSTTAAQPAPRSDAQRDAALPPEAEATLALIRRGGPFPYRQDGSVFGNREGRLPPQPRGWYREYTVPTPGLGHRGARRIVTGGDPPREWYYTDDHYASFRRITPP